MSIKIRLSRRGRKKVAVYRIVAADSHSPRDGRFLEILGDYNPQKEPAEINVKPDRIAYWLKQGAIQSQTVKNILGKVRINEQIEALEKNLDISTLDIKRGSERKRKKKNKKKAAKA